MDFCVPPLLHSPLPVQAYFGAMGTLTYANCCSLLADFGYLCAAYIPQDWTLGTDLAPMLASVRDAVFFGAASPIRLVLLVPTQVYCGAHDLHALPLIHTTLATGRPRTSPHDMTLVVLQNHAATGAWPMSQALCTAHLHPILTHMCLHPHSLPSHLKLSHIPDMKCHATVTRTAPCTPTVSLAVEPCGKSVFWRVWNRELHIRRELMRQPQPSWLDLVRSYKRCNAILPLAPQRWLRRLCVLIDWQHVHDLTDPGQWLYAIWNPIDGRIYWGQTGAIREARSVIDRFQGEMASARSWRTLYKGKLKGPTLLQVMHALGVENFVVVPVRRSTRLALDALETHFIRNEGPNLNDRRVRKKSYYRFLVRGDMLKKLAHSEIVNPDRWLRLPALKRLNIHPGDAIRILTAARKALPRHNFVPLQQKLIPYVARHTGIHLPYMLALPLPTQSHHLCRRVSKAFRLFLKETRLPRVVQEYLASMLRVVPNPVCKLGSTLVPATIDLSISDIIATLRDTPCCGCGDTAAKAHHC